MSGAAEVPLMELLRGIPNDVKLLIQSGPVDFPSSSSIPVGSYAHRAADEIERLTAIVAAAKRRIGDIKAIHSRWYDGVDKRPMDEILNQIEAYAFSVNCYLDGVPGLYLPAAPSDGS